MKKIALLLPVALLLTALPCAAQGPLTPPGAPAPTMKTLEQIEPRTPISSADYVISNSGSYYLTSNLTAAAGQNGITVDSDDVTIDLNGFTLTGSGATSGHGIYQADTLRNLRVHNGNVVQWGGLGRSGVYADGKNNQFDHIQAATNYWGIWAGEGSTISDCSAPYNRNDGIQTGPGATISACTASYNSGDGLNADWGSTISDCSAYNNSGDGLNADWGSTISDCSAYGNLNDGINALNGSTISDCSAYENFGNGIRALSNSTISGCSAYKNSGDGIQASDDSNITGNTCDKNGYAAGAGGGIHVTGTGNRIDSNNVRDNDRGIDVGDAENYVARNIVRSNTDNYDIAPGNQLNILLCEVPEDIDWPASVKFAGTLICASTSTNGITVNADDVTIDMDGHALVGPGAFSEHGIYQGSAYRNLRVHNGKVVQWRAEGKAGVYADGKNNQFDHIQAATNYWGIWAGDGATISDCTAYNNSDDGIYARYGSTISGCTARKNTDNGIFAGWDATISGCTASYNTGAGIFIGRGTISGCTASYNTGVGIIASESATISGCTARYNSGVGINALSSSTISGCTARYNSGDGIQAYEDSTITGNTCDNNGNDGGDGAGIHVTGSDNRIDSNNTTDNDRGIDVDLSGNLIIRNSASGNGTNNYVIVGGNTYGPLVTSSGALSSTGNESHPWANFSF